MDTDPLLSDEIAALRDRVMQKLISSYSGSNRSLSMVIAKLDEAELWAIKQAKESGRLAVVDRSVILRICEQEQEREAS